MGLTNLSQFWTTNPPFGLGFVPIEANFRCMAQLRQWRVRSRLHHIPFDYPFHHYNLRLTDYFVRASEPLLHPYGSFDEPTDIQHVELHQLFSQLELCGGAPDTSTTLIAPPSPGRSNVLTMCFLDEIADYGALMGLCRLTIMMRSYSRWLLVSLSQILHLVISCACFER